MTPWTEWTDEFFLGYCDTHCETPLALFSWEMAVKLYAMADIKLTFKGRPPGFIPLYADEAKPLIKTAWERLKVVPS